MFQMQRKPYLAGFFGVSNGRGNLNWIHNLLVFIGLYVFCFFLEYSLEYQVHLKCFEA